MNRSKRKERARCIRLYKANKSLREIILLEVFCAAKNGIEDDKLIKTISTLSGLDIENIKALINGCIIANKLIMIDLGRLGINELRLYHTYYTKQYSNIDRFTGMLKG